MYKCFVKRGIAFVIMIMLFGASVISFVNAEDVVSIRKNSNLIYQNPLVLSYQPPNPFILLVFVGSFNITFHGNVTHSGLIWNNLMIRCMWITRDPVNVSGKEIGNRSFNFDFEKGMSATAWFFTGYDGISMGINQPPGNVRGQALLVTITS